MAERSSPTSQTPMSPMPISPVQPLLVGDIVSIGIKLYVANFKDYLKLAWQGTLWGVLPYLGTIAIILFFTITNSFYSLLGLLIPALIVLFVFSLAKYLSYSALLSRLAFGELVAQSEPIETAYRYTERRKWSLLLSSVLLFLIYVVIGMPICLIMMIVFLAMVAAVSSASLFQGASPEVLSATVGVILLVLILAVSMLVLWLSGRLVSHDVPLAVEPGSTAAQSIGRMWQLTQRHAWRMAFVLTIAFSVTLPIQIVAQTVLAIAATGLEILFSENSSIRNLLSVLIATVIGFGFAIVLLPFWQAVRSVIYCDLRNRREGVGLQLRDRTEGTDDQSPRPTFTRYFQQVLVATPESVELEFTLAGVGRRTQALLLDYTFVFLIWIGFGIFWWLFSLGLLSSLNQITLDYSGVVAWLVALWVLTTFVIWTGYFAFFEVIWQGQTPGKRFAQIRVIRDDGTPIGLAQAVLRSLLLTVDYVLFIGVFLIAFNDQEKRLGDMVAGTLVVQEQRPPQKETILISAAAEQLAATELPMADLSQLSPDDFAIIRSYLQRRLGMDTKARNDLSLQLARQLRTTINLETIPPNTVSDHFIEAVYVAYQQQGRGDGEFGGMGQ